LLGVITESAERYFGPLINQNFGWDLATLQNGKFYAAWAGLFFSVEPLDLYVLLILIVLSMGVLEYRRGTRLAAFGFFIIGPIASMITYLVLWPISNSGIGYVHMALYTPDMGSSTACLVCLGIFLTGQNVRWRKILILFVFSVLIGSFYHNMVYNFDHLSGFIVGLLTGTIVSYLTIRKKQPRPVDLQA
jgi:hypothetical protein